MIAADGLLMALRLSDSAFPVGGFAFSSGLEGAVDDGVVGSEADVVAFIADQLTGRWHTGDRVLLRQAWFAGDPVVIDHLTEATTFGDAVRHASVRAGGAMLTTYAALGNRAAIHYRELVERREALGHLPVVQAICLRESGLSHSAAEAVAGWQLANGMASAALRLGIVGHLAAQRVLVSSTELLAELLETTRPRRPSGFSWFAEIAAQRTHHHARLFAS